MVVAEVVALDKKKAKVILEGGESFALYNGEIRRYGIESGGELQEEIQQEIYEKILKKRVKERCLYLLKSSDQTEWEIRTKLKRGCYPETMIDYGIAFLKEYGYVDDRRYAENYIRTYRERKSKRAMVQGLMQKGVSKEIIADAMDMSAVEASGQEECGLILKLLEKKHYNPETADNKEKNRLMAFLARKGFEMEDILRCMKDGQGNR